MTQPVVRWRRACVAVVPGLVAAAVFLAVFAAVRERLPDRLGIHMGLDGRPDGFASPGVSLAMALATMVGLGVLLGGMGWFAHRSGASARAAAATSAGTAGFIGYLFVALLLANADVADPATELRFTMWYLLFALLVGAGVATLGWFLAGRDRPEDARAKEPPPDDAVRLRIGSRERVTWTRTVSSKGMWLAAGAMLVTGVALIVVAEGWALVPMLAVGLLLMAMARVRVTVDARELTVRPAALPKPRFKVPLDEVVAADTRPVRALRDFGGWGYRVRHDATGMVMRSSDALAVRCASGTVFVVTVDDAATAAATLNALADRSRRPPGRT